MKLLIIKSLFCPNNNHLDLLLDSIFKINKYFELADHTYEIDLLLIGWINKYSNEIDLYLSLLKIHFLNIHKIYWKINYGKYKMFNEMQIFLNNHQYDYMMYFDHDIHLDFNHMDTFQETFFKIFEEKIKDELIGILYLNQTPDCRHQNSIYENSLTILSNVICWSCDLSSYASGAFVVPTKIFNAIVPFDLISVYGLDDYYLSSKIKSLGYHCAVLKNIHAIHPFNACKKYSNWKYSIVKKLIENKKINYDLSIQESINFWNNY